MNDHPTEAQFLKEVASHQMIMVRDAGLYRHVRFKKPGTGCMHFDLITWPGYLCYCGDMGTYVFSRLDDMFQFFRTDREFNRRDGKTLEINLCYWSEKLQAVDGTRSAASATEFDEDRFKEVVIGDLISWIRDNRDKTTKDDRRELWDAVISEVICADGDNGGYRKQIAAHDFSHHVNNGVGDFYFQDFWEHNLTRYTYRFVWCCYALAWGIKQYDEAKALDLVAAP